MSPRTAEAQVQQAVRPRVTWDFETGTLAGWTPTGNAFLSQPTQGDNTMARVGVPSNRQGDFWIGTFERHPRGSGEPLGTAQGDRPTGTLTSASFRIQEGGGLSFLIGGGSGDDTRVELLLGDPIEQQQRQVLYATGENSETMRRVQWDLTPFAGQIGVIRIVDQSTVGWGHINADDFVFGTAGITVPNVTGRTVRDATAAVAAAELTLVRRRDVLSSSPPGTVVAQTPEPGSVVAPGDSVAVDVAVWGRVPDLTGMDTLRARRALERDRFLLGGWQSQPSPEAPGTIIAQRPPAGSVQPPGSGVQVVVAAPVATPSLLGRDTAVARRMLAELGLRVGVTRVIDADRTPGTVIDQRPSAGTPVPLQTAVDLAVAAGVEVPDLLGMDSLAAGEALRRGRLGLGSVTRERSPAEVGSLIRQGVPPGTMVPSGTPVDIWVAEGVPVPALQTLRIGEARDAIESGGLTLGAITETPSAAAMGTVVGQSPDPGAVVPLRTPVTVLLAQGVPVPSVVGISTGNARRALADRDLEMGSILQVESAEPPGTVLRQAPEAGRPVPLRSTVDLVVAQGVPVPDLSGTDTLQARSLLGAARLALGAAESRTSVAPVGSVIEQSPPAGDVVALGSPVDVVTAAGVEVPEVRNTVESSADSLVAARGLTLVADRRRWSLAPTGTVLEQDPPAGGPVVPLQTPITVVVARHVPVGWLSAGFLLLAGAPLAVARVRKRKTEKTKTDPQPKREASSVPRVDLRGHPDPGRQNFGGGEPPRTSMELRWRTRRGPGRASVETSDPLIRSERTLSREPREDEDR
ncbi:MAG TPA: PASTA domain-containing protein [Longimicrobiales bacterium]|nr:PASTA domain-containing protein [Longimicrobiales bacterium]